MRASSHSSVIKATWALAALCLGGTGCQSPLSTNLRQAIRAPQEPAFLACRNEVSSSSTPIACTQRGTEPPVGRIQNVGPDVSAAVSPVEDAPVRPIVWRAASQDCNCDPADVGSASQIVNWRSCVKEPVSPISDELPRELGKVTLPPYIIEPPDVLHIRMSRVIPRPPYHLEPLDELHLQVPPQDLLPGEPINGVYTVDAQGRIDLAYSYGKVDVAGLTLDEATEAIRATLSRLLKPPRLVVTLGRTRTFEPIQGLHLVRMDGTVSLGSYGDVYVAGRSLSEARQIIEAHLSRTLLRPEVTVDVAGYNSKVYYIIYDTSRQTQEVVRLPIVGGETVLDALSHVTGLLPAGKRIWIARPAPDHVGFRQILPVDWEAITQGGATHTNYQLLPGDRLFVQAKPCGLWQSCKLQLSSTFERLSGKERK